MRHQKYCIHLMDGTIITVEEMQNHPANEGIMSRLSNVGEDEVVTIGDEVNGFFYVKRKDISYVSAPGICR